MAKRKAHPKGNKVQDRFTRKKNPNRYVLKMLYKTKGGDR